jgi:hypothetical protein
MTCGAFFGTYASACRQADALLFQTCDRAAIDAACARSPVGKLLPDDLYVHITALPALEPVLRVYEGCGRAFLGEVEGANLIKIHWLTGKLSYLVYPDFETDPHPVLARSVRLRCGRGSFCVWTTTLHLEKGTDPICPNGPLGASHQWGQSPFRIRRSCTARKPSCQATTRCTPRSPA